MEDRSTSDIILVLRRLEQTGRAHDCVRISRGLGSYHGIIATYTSTQYYSLCSKLLVAKMDVSKRILVLNTSILKTSNSERRE